jgi:hypothetical protein
MSNVIDLAERRLKTSCLASNEWKVEEQSILDETLTDTFGAFLFLIDTRQSRFLTEILISSGIYDDGPIEVGKMAARMASYIAKNKKCLEKKVGTKIIINFYDTRQCRNIIRNIIMNHRGKRSKKGN